ncbi:MAG: NUDIX domain-containing protein [Bacteroidota bacterium]
MKLIAALLLQNPQGQFLFYLRDNKASIPYPHHWDMFGGHVEEGETVEEALVRELKEELDYELKEYSFFRVYRHEDEQTGQTEKYIFYTQIDIPENELVLYEGERLQFFEPEELKNLKFSHIIGQIVEDYQRDILQKKG